jgi:cell division septation protein DedD
MREFIDDEEPVAHKNGRDTELTLGAGTVVGLVFGLLLLCGLCFGLGYFAGRRAPMPAATTAPTAAPDQEPLQASGSIPKPTAEAQAPVTPPPADSTQPAADGETNPPPGETQDGSATGAAQGQVKPALPTNAPPAAPTGAAPGVHPALPQAGQFMVQIAAIASQEDADVLAGALRKRGYAVGERREPADGLIHVRIGPFASRDQAEQWRQRLQGDGYNAIVQQ